MLFLGNVLFSFLSLSRFHAQQGAQCGAQTHNPEIKSHMLYRLSQPGAQFYICLKPERELPGPGEGLAEACFWKSPGMLLINIS